MCGAAGGEHSYSACAFQSGIRSAPSVRHSPGRPRSCVGHAGRLESSARGRPETGCGGRLVRCCVALHHVGCALHCTVPMWAALLRISLHHACVGCSIAAHCFAPCGLLCCYDLTVLSRFDVDVAVSCVWHCCCLLCWHLVAAQECDRRVTSCDRRVTCVLQESFTGAHCSTIRPSSQSPNAS